MVNRYNGAVVVGKVAVRSHTYAPRLCERARDFKTRSVDSATPNRSDRVASILAPNSRESCGYVNIPKVRIDIHSARERSVLRCSLENCERVLDLSTIARLGDRIVG